MTAGHPTPNWAVSPGAAAREGGRCTARGRPDHLGRLCRRSLPARGGWSLLARSGSRRARPSCWEPRRIRRRRALFELCCGVAVIGAAQNRAAEISHGEQDCRPDKLERPIAIRIQIENEKDGPKKNTILKGDRSIAYPQKSLNEIISHRSGY